MRKNGIICQCPLLDIEKSWIFDSHKGKLTHKLGIMALIMCSSIQLVGQSRYLLQTLRGQKPSLIEACTHGFKQYRWVNAIPLMVFELLVPWLIAMVTFGIVFCVCMGLGNPTISETETLAVIVIAMGAIMILWIPCLWITSISYYGYYLIADQNLGGLTLYKEAYKMSRRAGLIKTLLLRCLYGCYMLKPMICIIMFGIRLTPMYNENLMCFPNIAWQMILIAPFSLSINAVMYENHKEIACTEEKDVM